MAAVKVSVIIVVVVLFPNPKQYSFRTERNGNVSNYSRFDLSVGGRYTGNV